jgi:hypothetical protein
MTQIMVGIGGRRRGRRRGGGRSGWLKLARRRCEEW